MLSPPSNLYSEARAEQIGNTFMMDTHLQADRQTAADLPRRGLYSLTMIGRDLGYILPGFPISVLSFSLLLPLFATSVSTAIIWVGVLLLPITLLCASFFAELSRNRLQWWGGGVSAPRYLERGTGMLGLLRILRDPRRWLDLAFETVISFPMRIFTFVVTITWVTAALGGITWAFWGFFLPREGNVFPANFLIAISEGAISPEVANSFAAEATVYTVFGIAACALTPPIVRGLALLDATVTRAALGSASDPTADREWQRPMARRISSAEGWAWITAGYSAAILVAVGWPVLSSIYSVHVAIAMVLVIGQAAALLLAIRLPAIAITVATVVPAVTALVASIHPEVPWPWPVSMLIVQSGIVLIVALRHRWPWAITAWLLPQLAVIATVPAGSGFTSGAVTNLVVSASISLGVVLLGIVIRAFAADRGALVEERRANAELDAKQRELAARNLVARELHDVVAHSMSVVSIQANTAKYRIPGLDAAAEAEFAAIAQSSRQALTEMRSLLATLRAPEGTAPLVPQPTLADLPALIETSRQSGATIAFRADGCADGDASAQVPAATALTAYRIAQEALSNAMRHSPGADIDVTIAVTDPEITVAVTNGPPSLPAGGAPGSGSGLSGLSERVAVLGGTIAAGPTADGGFSVRATLPLIPGLGRDSREP